MNKRTVAITIDLDELDDLQWALAIAMTRLENENERHANSSSDSLKGLIPKKREQIERYRKLLGKLSEVKR